MENTVSTARDFDRICAMREIMLLFAWCALLIGVAYGQAEQSTQCCKDA